MIIAEAILQCFEGRLFCLGGGVWRGDREDRLGEGEVRVGEVLWLAHDECLSGPG